MKTHSVNVLVVLNLASAASVNAQTSDVTNAQVIIISQVVLLLHLIAVTVVVVLRLHRKVMVIEYINGPSNLES